MNPIIYCIIFLSTFAHANFSHLNDVEVPRLEYNQQPRDHYILPNELTPRFFGDKAFDETKGLMVSVGTIRSLIGFSWAKNITHLWMADSDNDVVEFNKKHLLLLRCIEESHPHNYLLQRLHYVANFHGYELRKQDIEDYKNAGQVEISRFRSGLLFHKTPLNDDSCWKQADFKEADLFIALHRNTRTTQLFNYSRTNEERYYWEDDEQWQKLIDSSLTGKIAVSQIDIVKDVEIMINFIQSTGLGWGIFDVSNVPSFLSMQNNIEWAHHLLNNQPQPQLILSTTLMHRNQFNYSSLNPERFRLHVEMARSLR